NTLTIQTKRVRVHVDLIHGPDFGRNDLNRIPRSRGFVFLLLGAVCALLEGKDELFVYENGIGAINLNYGSPEVGLDQSRAVHPISLIEMSHLVSNTLDAPFAFHNPFLFTTKAQMCEVFNRLPEQFLVQVNRLVSKTVSCDRRSRIPKELMQCGCCSSCL